MPYQKFQEWYTQAEKRGFWRRLLTTLYPPAVIHQPDAMTLATATPDGVPSARIVLLKGVDRGRFLFFTNYLSKKGQDLAQNPNVALVFHWNFPERQVRIRGQASRLTRDESEAYWATRPRGSQISGAASPQSKPVPNRGELQKAVAEIEKKFGGSPLPCPDFWGGFAVDPYEIEFWEARANRLHERTLYQKDSSSNIWTISILAP